MNDPFATTPTVFPAEPWLRYETENARAVLEYRYRPSARPHVSHHYYCLCCDTLTEQRSMVCDCCQRRSPEWREVAADPDALKELRAARRRLGANRRNGDVR